MGKVAMVGQRVKTRARTTSFMKQLDIGDKETAGVQLDYENLQSFAPGATHS